MRPCPWCGNPFPPKRQGDREKQFCSDICRSHFWSAARRWIARAIKAGLLSVDDLKASPPAVHGGDKAA